ncbi:MAG: DNA primase, partial [Spirochaetes bacterium]|nr:DNA primase [Spirochaetota bacterium]
MSIPRETIDLIRDRAQIEDIIKRYVPSMKKRGANYIGLCPFHKEKTPSFTVSPEKQIFHCFGCQAGGNIYSFISKIEGLNFPESVKFVGNLVGIRVDEDKKDENTGEYKKLKDINNTAAELFHNTIKTEQGKKGLNYLLKRGVTKESIIEFKLGYSPDSWDFLTSYLNNKKIPLNLASEAGLLSISDKGGDKKRYYDRFRDRVIFPIFNRRNEIAAFGGRILENGEPKYLNSPESRIYQKRRELYGFNIAKEHISSLGRAIIVEGYLDVIGCHQAGVKNVVAPLGTALTSEQVRTLSRLCSEIVLLFDADSAGINAALRSIDVVKDININLKIAVLPDGDPFDFIPRKGIREFMIVVDQALSPVDFQITRIIKS